MSIFKKSESRQAKLKMGIYGGTGSGKTWTAALVIAGLHKLAKSKKPVYMLDTETGSDFIDTRIFKPAGIELRLARSRSFPDACAAVKEAEAEGFALLIDSITHVWDDFTSSYRRKMNQKFIEIWDWKPIKDEWRSFTDLYINSNLHIVLCGRSGAVYDTIDEVRNGQVKEKTVKVGTKMRAEGEMGYEPSLLVEMEKEYTDDGVGAYYRMARVIKDRFNVIDSKEFKNPTFENFLPYINLLNLDGKHEGIDPSRDSQGVFDASGDGDMARRAKRRTILAEEIQAGIVLHIPGTTAKEKVAKSQVLFELFGTRSWTAIESDWTNVKLERMEEVMKPRDKAPSFLEQACIKQNELMESVGS